ncbi:MAG TPA: sugar ABC transporter substrate-binding protein [Spirochaetia bacterium]|nr:sugar ABC transporter substrate-binding protein [Spirochaetia bacterium]
MRKKLLSVTMITLLSLTVIASLAGCGASTAQQSGSAKTYTVAFLTANMPDPFYVSIYYGAVQEAKQLGNVKIIMLDAGGYSNVSQQANQIDEAVADKVDAIDLAATSPAGTASAVARAWQAGIPVIGYTSATNGKTAFYVGSSQQQLGEDQAKYMVQTLNGKGNVVMIDGPAGVSWAVQRSQAFKDYVAKYPGIHILAEKWGPSDRPTGMTTMENLLQTFPNIDGVYTGSDANGDGVAAALVAAGKAGKIVLTTAVMEPDTKTYIEKGVINMTAAQQGVTIGATTVKDTIAYLQKQAIPDNVSVPDLVVTKQNVGSVDLSTIQQPADFKP